MRERLVSPNLISKEEEGFNCTLRPPTLEEYVGQKKLVEKLNIALQAARQRSEPLEHALFYGPPGLGKTTLAYIIANAMGSKITTTSGPALERTGDLMGILTNLGEGDIDWLEVRRALTEVGYRGYVTTEVAAGDADYLKDLGRRVDRFLAGPTLVDNPPILMAAPALLLPQVGRRSS